MYNINTLYTMQTFIVFVLKNICKQRIFIKPFRYYTDLHFKTGSTINSRTIKHLFLSLNLRIDKMHIDFCIWELATFVLICTVPSGAVKYQETIANCKNYSRQKPDSTKTWQYKNLTVHQINLFIRPALYLSTPFNEIIDKWGQVKLPCMNLNNICLSNGCGTVYSCTVHIQIVPGKTERYTKWNSSFYWKFSWSYSFILERWSNYAYVISTFSHKEDMSNTCTKHMLNLFIKYERGGKF